MTIFLSSHWSIKLQNNFTRFDSFFSILIRIKQMFKRNHFYNYQDLTIFEFKRFITRNVFNAIGRKMLRLCIFGVLKRSLYQECHSLCQTFFWRSRDSQSRVLEWKGPWWSACLPSYVTILNSNLAEVYSFVSTCSKRGPYLKAYKVMKQKST